MRDYKLLYSILYKKPGGPGEMGGGQVICQAGRGRGGVNRVDSCNHIPMYLKSSLTSTK